MELSKGTYLALHPTELNRQVSLPLDLLGAAYLTSSRDLFHVRGEDRFCVVCGDNIKEGDRTDRKTCSNRCRLIQSRSRNKTG